MYEIGIPYVIIRKVTGFISYSGASYLTLALINNAKTLQNQEKNSMISMWEMI